MANNVKKADRKRSGALNFVQNAVESLYTANDLLNAQIADDQAEITFRVERRDEAKAAVEANTITIAKFEDLLN